MTRFNKIIGVGGIGSGLFFNLEGDHTLGREESRMAELADYKDYCKLHIILSYPARLLQNVAVFPVGYVGKDGIGDNLISHMQFCGMQTDFVKQIEKPTMLSVCFHYPSGQGGNITSSNSACSEISKEFIDNALINADEKTIALAAPEIPLNMRLHFLRESKARGAFTIASYASGEAKDFMQAVKYCNLISINIEEARASLKEGDSDNVAKSLYETLRQTKQDIVLVVTLGKNGVVCFHNGTEQHLPAIQASVVSTAGAGDAMLGGIISGLSLGFPLHKVGNKLSAVELGTICSALAVASYDTIPSDFSKPLINNTFKRLGIKGEL